jgi:beta-galactosidase
MTSNFNKNRFAGLVLPLALLMAAAPQVPAAEPMKVAVSATDCQTGLAQIRDRLAALEIEIERAKKSGIDTSYEEVTAFTAHEFGTYIGWDLAHPQELARIVGQWWTLGTNAPQLAAAIPGQEIRDTLVILTNATLELARVEQNPAARRPAPRLIDGGRLHLAGDYWHQQERPVFLGTFGWMLEDDRYGQAYGRLPSIYLTLRNLAGEDMVVQPSSLREIKRRAESYGQSGTVFEVFFDNSPPPWAVEKYPEITEGRRQFIGYDIDHPKVKEMWQHYLAEVIPVIKAGAGESAIYMLANEPHWFTTTKVWSTGTVSDYTWKRFQDWLARRYQQDLAALNQRWGKKFAAFDQVRLELPMETAANKGSAPWYDWCRFNMDRVNDWFSFLSSEIKKHDPQARCTIKLISKLCISTEFERDNGLDFETLTTDVEDFSGADTDVEAPCDKQFRAEKNPAWMNQYAMHWEAQSMYYDFLKSLAPQKLIFDCEYHALSAVSWRAQDLGPDYVRAVLWLAHLHGLGMNEAWYLPRLKDGGLTGRCESDVYGSVSVQPLVADAYGRAMKELNAYAPEVIALAKAPKSVRFFYSTDAAIQSPSYHKTMLKAYEAAYFLSVPLGFATERMLATAEPAQLKEYPLLIVPSATHVKDSAMAALKRYVQSGGKVVLLGESSLLLDEYGRERDKDMLAFLKDAPHIGAEETAETMASRLEALIGSAGIKRPVVCRSAEGKVPWGVHCVSVKRGEATLVHVVNLAKDARTVSLWAGDQAVGEALDLWRNEKTSVRRMTLQPYEMRLLSIPREQGNKP